MKLIKTLKGGSLSSTNVIQDGGRIFVRKSIARNLNREYGLVRWQSQIRKLQLLEKFIPESTIIIERVGATDEFYYYDIPYYENCLNCVEAILSGLSVDTIAEKTSILLSKMASIEYQPSRGSLSLYIAEEILSPLIMAGKMASSNSLDLTDAESKEFRYTVSNAINLVENLQSQTTNIILKESLNHGNLTLENMLWDSNSKELIMIDPYGETYCDTILGDVSQLLQSAASGYEYISDKFEGAEFKISDYPINHIPRCLIDYSKKLIEKISDKGWYSDEYLALLRASQFTRMFPFKLHKSPRSAVAFMMHGINLLKGH
jgi:hypothetical protein